MTIHPTQDVRNVRKVASGNVPKIGALHRDGLGSVRADHADDGLRNETDVYRPFGEQAETIVSASAVREAKGYHRRDATTRMRGCCTSTPGTTIRAWGCSCSRTGGR